jgi:hypothetical protein
MLRGRDNSESCEGRANCVGIQRGNVVRVKMTIVGVRGSSEILNLLNGSNKFIDV